MSVESNLVSAERRLIDGIPSRRTGDEGTQRQPIVLARSFLRGGLVSGEKAKRPWSHPVSNKVLLIAVVVGALGSAAGAPPIAIVLWGWAFIAWRKRKKEERAALGGAPVAGALEVPDDRQPLADDPRSAWAYRRYCGGLEPAPVSPVLAERILATLQPGDHVELIADAATCAGWQVDTMLKKARPSSGAAIALRTLRGWIVADRKTARITVAPGPLAKGRAVRTADAVTWPVSGLAMELSAPDRPKFTLKVFLDRLNTVDLDILEEGAGAHIRRLPEAPEVPPAPDPDTMTNFEPALPTGLPTDWKAAEEIAQAHMCEIGFSDARLTGAGRDGGIDVTSALGVAQVKMQALPVGAGLVQQLRGSRPDAAHHLFYSTSGYTSAALEAADQTHVGLFTITSSGAVSAVNDMAQGLVRTSGIRSGVYPEGPDLKQWAQELCDRVMTAVNSTDAKRAAHHERYPGQWKRVAGYQLQALKNLDNRPTTFESAKAAVIFYHHNELLAAVYFRELGIPYPGGAGDKVSEELEDFYS
ncbi:restriction endonuclease [Actinoplanes sp. NPDC048988]|uniref:restriction endonuclease n=1 Tax=Actinoplanes sp. NPDC048988 TaxID=3363901 RepID=UPI00371DBB46